MKDLLLLCIAFVSLLDIYQCCECVYHYNGCIINKGASNDNETCKCVYRGEYCTKTAIKELHLCKVNTCTSITVVCRLYYANVCKKGCTTVECCNAGGGDCRGYNK
nr:uncharacterized protein LOC124810790 [Hydra vulgaris]